MLEIIAIFVYSIFIEIIVGFVREFFRKGAILKGIHIRSGYLFSSLIPIRDGKILKKTCMNEIVVNYIISVIVVDS